MEPVEIIRAGDLPLAYIVRAGWMPGETTFLTPDDFGQQIGMIVYGAGKEIQPHVHLPVVREVHGTTECIVVRKGACQLDLYDDQRNPVCSRELQQGDIALLIAGGHGFRMTEDTVLFEVKQGPFVNGRDKSKFTRPE